MKPPTVRTSVKTVVEPSPAAIGWAVSVLKSGSV